MGALRNNRKRGEDHFGLRYFTSSHHSPHLDIQIDLHVSKKPRISYTHSSPQRQISSVSSESSLPVIRRYPEPVLRIRREVHAPCRKPRFSFSAHLGREIRTGEMGNFFSRRSKQAKSVAFDTFEHRRKDEAVIDAEAECSEDVISDDSSVQELEILDDVREGESNHRSLQTSADAYLKEKYEKFADDRVNESSSIVSDLTNHTPKVDEAGKMLESLYVNHGLEKLGLPPHKQLFESAERRNSRLDHLAFEIDLTEKKLSFLSTTTKKSEKDVYADAFAPLTAEEETEVLRAWDRSNWRKILVTHENSCIDITGEILQCLQPGAWLNDEVINVYLELLKERENREPKRFLKCHFFNTFFYKKLISGRGGYDFKAVRRWTSQKKIGYGLIDCDKIFVPIHKDIHWCLAVINKRDEKLQYLDSLKGRDTRVLTVLARYFVDEVKDKCAKDIDLSSWKHEYVDELPEQQNGSDCGVFMIKYADFYSRGLGLHFEQEDMPYFRMRTAKEILRLKAE